MSERITRLKKQHTETEYIITYTNRFILLLGIGFLLQLLGAISIGPQNLESVGLALCGIGLVYFIVHYSVSFRMLVTNR